MDEIKQLKVLSRIWGNDREGYVFLPYIPGTAKTKTDRKKQWTEGRPYYWPKEKADILNHLKAHQSDDLYFTPQLFNEKERREVNAEPERTLWADLDPVDPKSIDQRYRPTIAWETSPGRYQAVWLLDRPMVGASWPGKENQRLTNYLEADPSGYDTTQLLRVPGRKNHKPDHRDKDGNHPVGKLLWDNGPRYVWSDFEDLPEVDTIDIREMEALDESLLASLDRHEIWAKVRLKVPQRIREFMAARETGGADRSAIMWEIERDLAKAGCSMGEIIVLVKDTIWNKFSGRRNEMMSLKSRAARALALVEDSPIEALGEEKPGINWITDVIAAGIPRPKWLVRNIWARGACGFIAGDPKSYKSWLAMDLGISIATGRDFLSYSGFSVMGGPQPVLIIQEEDDLALVASRAQQIIEARAPELFWHGQLHIDRKTREIYWEGPHHNLPIALHVATGFTASDETWQAWLDEVLAEGQFDMVIIDTLGTVAGEVDTDRSYELMSKMLNPLKILAKKHDTAMAIVHHNKKDSQNSGRAGKRMLGSVALHAWVESALYVAKDKPDHLIVESETKQARGHTMGVDIPNLGIVNDERTLWLPVVDPEASTERVQGDAGHNHASDAPKTRTGRSAGSALMFKLRQMASETHGRRPDEVLAALGSTKASFDRQVKAAVEAGEMRIDEADGLFYLARA